MGVGSISGRDSTGCGSGTVESMRVALDHFDVLDGYLILNGIFLYALFLLNRLSLLFIFPEAVEKSHRNPLSWFQMLVYRVSISRRIKPPTHNRDF